MPLGKSGKYHMNPHHMRASGDAPDHAEPQHEEAMQGREGEDGGAGDGKHHHEMTKHEDGSYTSKHTHPDGSQEHGEHADFHEAAGHMADKFEESDDGGEQEPDGDEDGRTNYAKDGALESLYDDGAY